MAHNQAVYAVTSAEDLRTGLPPIPYEPRAATTPAKYGRDNPFGRVQFERLRDAGLRPGHRVVEIGPGGFRLAQHLIAHLNAGDYACVEVSRLALDAGWQVLSAEERARRPLVLWGGDFSFDALPWRPDFLWAHSVVTHLTWNDIGKCLHETRKVIAPQGQFLATYLRAARQWEPQSYGKGSDARKTRLSYGDRNPFHYRFEILSALAEETGWRVMHEDWPDHPKGQSMLRFTPA